MRKKSKVLTLLTFLLTAIMVFVGACGAPKDPLANEKERMMDNGFSKGFELGAQKNTDSSVKIIDYKGNSTATLGSPTPWQLAQWGELFGDIRPSYDKTQHDLRLGNETLENGVYSLSTLSNSKKLVVVPGQGEIELHIDSTKEYGDLPRSTGEDWPHLLISQPFSDLIFLDKMENFYVDIEFEMLKNVKHAKNKETAQFQWIFTIQNLNEGAQSGAKKDYMWFNITYFDDRYDFAPGTSMIDSGKGDATGKFIYGPKGEKFMPSKVEVGKKMRITYDFLPEMKAAFAAAQSNGALKGSTLSEMAIGNMNIGWEVPGLYDIGIKITKLSLKCNVKK